MIKTLLLNYDFQVLAFIEERRAIKLILKGKVDIVSVWEGRKISYLNGYMEYPATIRMKYNIKTNPTKLTFSRKLVLRRDKYTCCYCNKAFKQNELTIDHVHPKSLGGTNSFSNCVTACISCNRKKGNRSLEEVGMILKSKPFIPNKYLCYIPNEITWHQDWLFFV